MNSAYKAVKDCVVYENSASENVSTNCLMVRFLKTRSSRMRSKQGSRQKMREATCTYFKAVKCTDSKWLRRALVLMSCFQRLSRSLLSSLYILPMHWVPTLRARQMAY